MTCCDDSQIMPLRCLFKVKKTKKKLTLKDDLTDQKNEGVRKKGKKSSKLDPNLKM